MERKSIFNEPESVTDDTVCPVHSWNGKFNVPMKELPDGFKRLLHSAEWLPWCYPKTKEYLDRVFGPFDLRLLARIDEAIKALFFHQFITYPATLRCIEALIKMTESKSVLELGMWNGFGTLHLVRAVYPHGKVTSIDLADRRSWTWPDGLGDDPVLSPPRPDGEGLFYELEKRGLFKFIQGDTVAEMGKLSGAFDLVFIDSDHSPSHTEQERQALWRITRPGTVFVFHDMPVDQNNSLTAYGQRLAAEGLLRGWNFQTPFRMDSWHQSGLGIFVRDK